VCNPKKDTTDKKKNRKMKDKLPTLRKIKRAAYQRTKPTQCSTFAFAPPHPSPPTALQEDKGQFEGNF